MSESVWAEYRSHKIVKAAVITGVGGKAPGRTPRLVVGDSELFEPNVSEMANKAHAGDYAVEYADGYKSVSPKAVFEDGYARV